MRQQYLTMEEATTRYQEFYTLKSYDRQDGQAICICCGQPSVGRSSVNVWGTICDIPTCSTCNTNFDGKRMDDIPKVNRESS